MKACISQSFKSHQEDPQDPSEREKRSKRLRTSRSTFKETSIDLAEAMLEKNKKVDSEGTEATSDLGKNAKQGIDEEITDEEYESDDKCLNQLCI
ncbi:hypothetical protein Tco_1225776 [Tanacetum coccineum]